MTLIALTDGFYEPETATFTAPDGTESYYTATDHLEHPSLTRLTPDDLLDLTPDNPLKWDAQEVVGPAFRLISAIAVAGQVGVTAIARTRQTADRTYERVKRRLMDVAQRV